jgi:hypothetical protein
LKLWIEPESTFRPNYQTDSEGCFGQVLDPFFKLLKKLAPRNLSLGYLDLIILFFTLEKLGSERSTLRTSEPNHFYVG